MFAELVKKERIKIKQEGEQIGIAKGKIEGKIEEKTNIIKNMYDNDLSLELISKVSQLPIKEVKKILKLND